MPRRKSSSSKKTRGRKGRKLNFGRPFAINPFGPQQPWLEQAPGSSEAPPSGFGSSYYEFQFGAAEPDGTETLHGRLVNPSGYLATWNGHPRIIPTSWNPLLLQGNHTFRQGIDGPTLSNVN